MARVGPHISVLSVNACFRQLTQQSLANAEVGNKAPTSHRVNQA